MSSIIYVLPLLTIAANDIFCDMYVSGLNLGTRIRLNIYCEAVYYLNSHEILTFCFHRRAASVPLDGCVFMFGIFSVSPSILTRVNTVQSLQISRRIL